MTPQDVLWAAFRDLAMFEIVYQTKRTSMPQCNHTDLPLPGGAAYEEQERPGGVSEVPPGGGQGRRAGRGPRHCQGVSVYHPVCSLKFAVCRVHYLLCSV